MFTKVEFVPIYSYVLDSMSAVNSHLYIVSKDKSHTKILNLIPFSPYVWKGTAQNKAHFESLSLVSQYLGRGGSRIISVRLKHLLIPCTSCKTAFAFFPQPWPSLRKLPASCSKLWTNISSSLISLVSSKPPRSAYTGVQFFTTFGHNPSSYLPSHHHPKTHKSPPLSCFSLEAWVPSFSPVRSRTAGVFICFYLLLICPNLACICLTEGQNKPFNKLGSVWILYPVPCQSFLWSGPCVNHKKKQWKKIP